MKAPVKVGRPARAQLRCHACKKTCSPKEGDWFHSDKPGASQVFLCKQCEASRAKTPLTRAIPQR